MQAPAVLSTVFSFLAGGKPHWLGNAGEAAYAKWMIAGPTQRSKMDSEKPFVNDSRKVGKNAMGSKCMAVALCRKRRKHLVGLLLERERQRCAKKGSTSSHVDSVAFVLAGILRKDLSILISQASTYGTVACDCSGFFAL